ncbi:MAG: DUF6549 family protein [Prolixibacteraceae bacterium]
MPNFQRRESNYKQKDAEAERFKTAAGDAATKVTAQEFTIKELRAAIPALIQEVKDAGIRPAALRSATETASEINRHISAVLRDSIKYSPKNISTGQPVASSTVKIFEYKDKWFTVKGEISDSIQMDISGKDTTKTFIYVQRRHPWAWILSRKEFRAVTVNKNPFIKTTPGQTIVIKL